MIRRASEQDIPAVTELLKQVLTVHADGRPDLFVHNTTKYAPEELSVLFRDDSHPVFVYTDETDTAVAHAFCILEKTEHHNNLYDMLTLYIDDICVDEGHRGQHIATALYEYIRDYAKKLGCYHVTLNVWECNPGARRFYEAMGMSIMKTTMEEIL